MIYKGAFAALLLIASANAHSDPKFSEFNTPECEKIFTFSGIALAKTSDVGSLERARRKSCINAISVAVKHLRSYANCSTETSPGDSFMLKIKSSIDNNNKKIDRLKMGFECAITLDSNIYEHLVNDALNAR